jgi:acetyltransferase-like isoleucine patch superfamily enzyme
MYKRSLVERILLKLYFIFSSIYFRTVHGIQIGSNCRISLSATIRGNIKIGKNVSIGKFTNITGNVIIDDFSYIADYARLNTMSEGQILIGKNCHINVYNIIGSSYKVTIKDYALFAAGVKITDATHSIKDLSIVTKKAKFEAKEVLIDENCWLGFDVNVIMGGRIGKNCVVGSKSLVNKPITSNSIAVGIPAKVIKERNTFEK